MGKRATDTAGIVRRKAAPFYPRQSCDLHIPRHLSPDSHNGLLLPSVAVFRAPHTSRVRAAQKAAVIPSEPEKSPGSNPTAAGGWPIEPAGTPPRVRDDCGLSQLSGVPCCDHSFISRVPPPPPLPLLEIDPVCSDTHLCTHL